MLNSRVKIMSLSHVSSIEVEQRRSLDIMKLGSQQVGRAIQVLVILQAKASVPKKPTLPDVDALISLELSSAMRVSVIKLDNTSFVMNSATVKDLKLAVKKKVNEMEQ
ncbi:putative U11/U12 small nuclear ribonucleoprotein 25kDa protein [Helianthus annuus]|uniref:U11/U12 small nuclear ribonucleoprotein 25kDa protein n=1 Tax=Helianthus annuus TaxID=4232 RepID=A0A9K3ICW0_HELAN|nr:putative U11/U12 small nuclear ribonucleoprotein 25kDa protein [Helianthus annuus]KAJ0537943.1 putative U11/U12 small nuclear ribonucleoprotein 25kDa protein [Helianthus annuus]KAJ0545652.1 putative U11/U12 small nuclear ribonucleoprotein 25kDa protein [Helianthus annuus]KAJ0552529.1 putative U11/U12 small nuclear ribonucleoprotein 25kDa protein [Helianthus annuus]KAJ0718226.1 putative U11/U12 small nuclear ribonucleoprotein 25kDa protein [Helianthus annuus]